MNATVDAQWVFVTTATIAFRNGVQLEEGLNTDMRPWYAHKGIPSGFVCARLRDIYRHLHTCGTDGAALLWNVHIPRGTPRAEYPRFVKAQRIHLSHPRSIPEWVYLAACHRRGGDLQYVPASKRTPTMCWYAVQQDGKALRLVPLRMRTAAVCLAAVQCDGNALKHVPEDLRTEALCCAAVKQSAWALCFVPNAVCTEAMCLAAVQHDGTILRYVPDELCTEAVCQAAVQQTIRAARFVPDDKRTGAMCYAAAARGVVLTPRRISVWD